MMFRQRVPVTNSSEHDAPSERVTVESDVARALDALANTADIRAVEFPTDRPVLGSLSVVVKRGLRRLLTAVFSRQVAYNDANLHVLNSLQKQLEHVVEELARVNRTAASEEATTARLAALQDAIARCNASLQSLLGRTDELATVADTLAQGQDAVRRDGSAAGARIEAVAGELSRFAAHVSTIESQTRHKFMLMERRQRRVEHVITDGATSDSTEPKRFAPETAAALQAFDQLGFEDRFRGSEVDIRERQRVYLRWFEGRQGVLDIGCGRGEFLELLRDAGIRGTGVDTNLDVILTCREKGLDVLQTDALQHLASLPDASIGGVFAAQVVEHLEAPTIIELVRLAHRKLEPGGVLIAETVNPTCLTVFAESFYMDLTHIRPIHPESLRFVAEAAGFGETDIHWSGPVDPAVRIPALPAEGLSTDAITRFNGAIEHLNDLLYGFRDYAVIARKVPPREAV